VTKQVKTVVVLETEPPNPTSFRIFGGERVEMGEQLFCTSKEANGRNLCRLDTALPNRSFAFLDRQVLLLVCGEITLMNGRPPGAGFRRGVPETMEKTVRAPGMMILNPTHTRMNRWEVEEWRKYLSSEGHTCVSASNWDHCAKRPQLKPSPALHTLWHDGQKQNPVHTFENYLLCYREWHLPKV